MKVGKIYYVSNIIFYFCIVIMIIMDYINYNDYIWGILGIVMIISFLLSLTPDILIGLNYKISQTFVRNSIISKFICFILFFCVWSYLKSYYKLIALFVFILVLFYDIYLCSKIRREIVKENIELKIVLQRILELDIKDKEKIYNLLYKGIIGFIFYISFPKGNVMFCIVSSVAVFMFELIIIQKMRLEIIKIYPRDMKKINILSSMMIINTIIIMLSVSNGKLFFCCLFIGLNWGIIGRYINGRM